MNQSRFGKGSDPNLTGAARDALPGHRLHAAGVWFRDVAFDAFGPRLSAAPMDWRRQANDISVTFLRDIDLSGAYM